MTKFSYLISAFCLFFSCTTKVEKSVIKDAKPKQEKRVIEVIPNKLLTLEVEGMSCEMNCGGSIRKELKKTGAISRVEFVWVEEAERQSTKISYDDTKISDKEILTLIENMNDGQFTTYGAKTEKISEIKAK